MFPNQMISSAEQLENFLKKEFLSKGVLIIDENVYPLHGESLLATVRKAGLTIDSIVLPAGESTKSLSFAEECWKRMHSLQLDRKSFVIGLGGGVITDLSGFVASCYMRGIASVLIPTTLMGMVDASIGGKNGVNLPGGKNLIGTFYQPSLVMIAPHFLHSLPKRELFSGLGEVIKSAVIWDEDFFKYLEKNLEETIKLGPGSMNYIIERAGSIKVEIVKQDEKDKGIRAFLNWGHTFAHALETLTNYTTFTHGEAVSIGMCCAAKVSLELGLVENSFVERQQSLCKTANLPTKLPQNINIDQMIELMTGDKKATGGKINLILARKIGQVEIVNDVDKKLIKKALNK